ncbi:MAG: tripartite tricarboxylate transporter substrate binding protein [Burkholderiales bacterium]
MLHLCRLLAIASASLASVAAWAQPAWKPEKNVEIIVPAAPGAAFDTTGRTLQRLLQDQKVLPVTSSVINKAGGGGTIAMSYLNQHTGDGHYLFVMTASVLTNNILGVSKDTYTDFTPLAMLFSEYLAYGVRTDSPIKSAKDLADALRKDPTRYSIAVATSRGGALHIATGLALKAAGVDVKKLRIVVFNANAESLTAMLGGHVDVAVSTVNSFVPQAQAGKLRVIAVSSPRRLPGFAEAPTWKEQGIDADYASWRGIMGPRGLNAAQTAYWEDVFGKLTRTNEWRQDVEKNLWEVTYKGSRDTVREMSEHNEQLKRILTELELVK